MRTGSTYTDHFQIEGRQHQLFNVDLGEGIPRGALLFTFLAYVIWCVPIFMLVGLPHQVVVTLYLAPPAIFSMVGHRMSPDGRRRNVAIWFLRIRYRLMGHRPIICGGRRAASRSEWIPRQYRRRGYEPEDESSIRVVALAGPPIIHEARPRLYGPDYLYKLLSSKRGNK